MTGGRGATGAGTPRFAGVLFGAAYYAEYQRFEHLEDDLDLMVAAGFNVIRVGESVWSTWEPADGQFDLDWLAPVLDAAQHRGLGVIVGTPTYAVPPWLQRLHPEIAAEVRTGERHPWGGRQEMDQSHPTYRFYAERIVRQVVQRYVGHPAVIGWQVDNEPGFRLPHNEHTFQRFVTWLKGRYGTVEALNEAWGLVYWSHRLSDWAELWRPDGNTLPEYDLAWRRFQATLADELIAWQADIVREYARDDQFVTTCLSYSRGQVADDKLVVSLDVVAGNPYYRMQHGLDWDVDPVREELWWHEGVWALCEWGDRAWSSAQCQYLVTETNAQSVGASWQNFPPYPGQLRQAAYALLARGGRMIEYWQWNTLTFGAEAYWGGVLPHSGKPGRIYREVAALGAELQALGERLDGFVPDADVLMLYSTDTKWAMEFAPPLADQRGGPNSEAYLDIFDSFYRGFFEAGAQVRIQHVAQFLKWDPADLVAAYPTLVAASVYVADDEVLEALRCYAEAGGHLILGPRTGYGDGSGRVRREVAPARLAGAAGVSYEEYSNLVRPLPVTSSDPGFALSAGAAGTQWVENLEPDSARVLATYADNELGLGAAVTTQTFGRGRISYVGTIPNPCLARSVASWAMPTTAKTEWKASESVTVLTGSSPAQSLTFLSNWSNEPAEAIAPSPLRDVLAGTTFAAGDLIPLEQRAVLVLEALEHPTGVTPSLPLKAAP